MSVAKYIDHTNIAKGAKAAEIKKTCAEAKKYGFRSVVVNPEWVKLAKQELKNAPIMVGVLIDPPMGLSPHQARVKACQKAKKDGADELDVVMNIVDLKYERYAKVLSDLKALCRILSTKVIIGSGFLTDEEITKASQLVKKAGAICVKTATEKDPLEHRELKEKLHHLKLMRAGAPGLLVKASGRINTLSDLRAAVRAGANIAGTSSGVKIMAELKKER